MKLILASIAATLVATGSAAAAQGGFGQPLPPDQNEAVRTSFYIPMADGTRLAADLYRPAKNGVPLPGKFPVILHAAAARSRLDDKADRSGAGRFSSQMINLANHGYNYMVVERRGLGASFGVRRGYHDRTEAGDSRYLTEWAASQPWSTGKVGVYGCSNTGDAAMHFLTNAAPQLKAVFAGCFNWDKYSGGRRGGVLANWGTGPQSSFEQDMKATPVDGDEERVLLRQAAMQHSANTPLLDLWSGMPYRDTVSPLTKTAFWEEGSIGTYADKVRESGVPVYIQGGWQDDFNAQGFITFVNLKQPVKLIVGNWKHCTSDDFAMTAEALRYFNYWLKGEANGIMDEPRIHYETVNAAPAGSHAWRTTNVWPLAAAARDTVYLSDGKALATQVPSTAAGKATFQVDYKVSCAQGTGLGPTCPQDDKGATFTSAPLAADMEVTGHPLADLWVSSSATDGPVFAYLEDIAPDGAITMVSEGRLQASQRKLSAPPYALPGIPWHSFRAADAEPMVPGQPARLVFDMLPISYVFKAGHRYRVTVTGADPREKLRHEVAPAPVLTVYYDRAHPSRIELPVVR